MRLALARAPSRVMSTAEAIAAPVAAAVSRKIAAAFSPAHVEIVNESHMHNVPRGSETHFKASGAQSFARRLRRLTRTDAAQVIVVSDSFAEQKLIQRHRMVNEALAEELAGCAPASRHGWRHASPPGAPLRAGRSTRSLLSQRRPSSGRSPAVPSLRRPSAWGAPRDDDDRARPGARGDVRDARRLPQRSGVRALTIH